MHWIERYQLVLLDFDGLLVNTEALHREAYDRLLKEYGLSMPWDFSTYCSVAHASSTGVRDGLFKEFPDLQLIQPDWSKLHARKTELIEQLIEEGQVELMPGVLRFLNKLKSAHIKRVVVTHSKRRLVAAIRRQLPDLECIQCWLTREDFTHTKPDPEGYLKAIELKGGRGDRVIGFEDSARGLQALMGTPAQPVAICPLEYDDPRAWVPDDVPLFRSFDEVMESESLPIPQDSRP